MTIVRSASVVIQSRIRSILARINAARFRSSRIEHERLRTEREERYVARAVQDMIDTMKTKRGGWKKYKGVGGKKQLGMAGQARKEVIIERRKRKAALLLKIGRARRLHTLRDWFELCDTDGSGYINIEQFRLLMIEMVIPMSAADIDEAWKVTEPPRGGYRRADLPGLRELGEIISWYEAHQSRGTVLQRINRGRKRQWLKVGKWFRDLWGRSKKQAARKLCAEARAKALEAFREIEPAPCGTCPDCHKRFIFTYELELHYKHGDGKCPGLYAIPQLSKFGQEMQKKSEAK